MQPRTLFDKIWDSHVVRAATPQTPPIIYVDLHLVHEASSPQAFEELRRKGLRVRRPERTVATADHVVPTDGSDRTAASLSRSSGARAQVVRLEENCREFGIAVYSGTHERQGIVHVIGPELGLTQPGSVVCCGDSHTTTHGAFGAWGFGVGTTEVAHILATQSLFQRKPRNFLVWVDGELARGVTAKDLALHVISRIGIDGGNGHVLEFAGPAVRALSMEGRMTLCNMSIEGGARAGLVAPDDVTFEYLSGCPESPRGRAWEEALRRWRELPTDPGAEYDRSMRCDAAEVEPRISFGTNPSMTISIRGRIPEPRGDENLAGALRYMDLSPGTQLLGHPIDVVFVGSCTNSRLSDLRLAASVLAGRRVARGVRMLVVPGSRRVKQLAESEGLDRVFRDAGAEWREPGCSMCIAMNGDHLEPGQYAISTSNRNFEGRQGRGGRTFLASPLTAAASAVRGCIADAREVAIGGAVTPAAGARVA
jgi:3-isopropylmalate/(R)-2-methylmalate dehydratase large subunit